MDGGTKVAMMPASDLIDVRARTRRDVTIEVLQPDRLELDLDGLMDFRAGSRLLAEGERTAHRYLTSRGTAEIA